MVSRAKLFGIALCFLFVSQSGFAQQYNYEKRQGIAQDAAGEELDDGDFNFWESMLTLFFPRGVKDTWRLKRYIRSERFSSVRGRAGDLRAVDAILRRALEISHGDVSEALFICTFASMEHRMVGIRLPLIRLPVYFPLTSESDSVFRVRVSQLPSHFYADSPREEYGDRDKLQHFFGSAFIAYSFHSRPLANFVGDFIEWGEEELIIEGVSDPRDRRANHQGQELGFALAERPDVNPSDFLQIQLVLTGSRIDW